MCVNLAMLCVKAQLCDSGMPTLPECDRALPLLTSSSELRILHAICEIRSRPAREKMSLTDRKRKMHGRKSRMATRPICRVDLRSNMDDLSASIEWRIFEQFILLRRFKSLAS